MKIGNLGKYLLIGIFALGLLLTAGCTEQEKEETGKPSAPPASSQQSPAPAPSGTKTEEPTKAGEQQPKEISFKVYYPNGDGTKLIAVIRKAKPDPDQYTAAMLSLMSGTEDNGQINVIPQKAKLLGVTVKNGLASVNFDQGLVDKFTGGSTGETMLIGSIVNTLTEFPEINQVQILVDGHAVETIAGHEDTSKPIARMDNLIE